MCIASKDEDEVPGILYHYCSIDTFMEIINNKTIRLSNIFKTNDSSEVIHVLKFLSDTLAEKYKKDPFPFEYHGIENEKAFDLIVSDTIKNINEVIFSSYIASFSESEDDLGQWNRYGDNGKGVAIGYNGKILKEIAKLCSVANTKVVYDEKKQKESVKDNMAPLIFEAIKKAGDNGNVKNGFFTRDEMVQIQNNSYISAILLSAIKYKHEAYKNEKEWRLYLNTPEITKLFYPEGIKKYSGKKHYVDVVRNEISFINKADKGISSYMDLSFGKFNDASKIITKIILGPRSMINERDVDLRIFLHINNFDIGLPNIACSAIRQSEIPYRG